MDLYCKSVWADGLQASSSGLPNLPTTTTLGRDERSQNSQHLLEFATTLIANQVCSLQASLYCLLAASVAVPKPGFLQPVITTLPCLASIHRQRFGRRSLGMLKTP